MIRPLSSRERRLVAVLILIAVVAAAHLLVIAPVMAGFATRAERRDALVLLYRHNLRTIAAIPRLRRQAERQRDAIASFVAPVAGVEGGREWLKRRLGAAVERAGGEVRDATDAEGAAGWIGARVTARLTLPQLLAVLKPLGDDPPFLVTRSLTITADEALVTGRPSIMDVQLEASVPLRHAAAR